jgi:D-alanine--poly(phosphoribitol) ligase subunit 2
MSVSVSIPQLMKIFSENLLIRVPSPDTDLLEGGTFDSMKLVELLLHLEQEFGISVPIESLDIESFRSVSTIAALLEASQTPVECVAATVPQ